MPFTEFGAFDHMLEGCQVIDRDWTYVYVNEAAARHGRQASQDLVGRRMMDVYPGIDGTPMFAAFERCMAAGTTETFENAFVFPDGSAGWFELRVQPVPAGIFVLSIDITARVQAERATARQVTRLRSLRAIDLAILGHHDRHSSLRVVLEEAVCQPHTASAALYLIDSSKTVLELADSVGPAVDAASGCVPLASCGIGGAARTRARVLLAGETLPGGWAQAGIGQACAVPLLSKGDVLGVLVTGFSGDLLADADECVTFLDALAGQASMAIESSQTFADLQQANRELASAYDTTLEGWAHALDLRDHETAGHTRRVCEGALALGARAGLTADELLHLKRGAILHDIGKMAIPDAILLKAGRLTADERREIEQHPDVAHRMLWPIGYLRPAIHIPYCHHEHWDGSGYPRGLRGTEIPLPARLFTVVDVWDALCSDRSYRPAWSPADALAHIRGLSGTQFDPSVADLFVGLVTEGVLARPSSLMGSVSR